MEDIRYTIANYTVHVYIFLFFAFILGMLSPKLVLWWGNKKHRTRGRVFKVCFLSTIVTTFVSIIVYSANLPPSVATKKVKTIDYKIDNVKKQEKQCKKPFTMLNFVNVEQTSFDKIEFLIETDLPNGLEFFINVQEANLKPTNKYIATDTNKIKVEAGRLKGFIEMRTRDNKFLPQGIYQLHLYTGSQWYFDKKFVIKNYKMTNEEKTSMKKLENMEKI